MKEIMIGFAVLLGRPDRKVLLRGLAGYEMWAIDCAEFLDRLISCLRERIFLQSVCSMKMYLLSFRIVKDFITSRGILLGLYVPRPQKSNDYFVHELCITTCRIYSMTVRAAFIVMSLQ
jgi:hypothetical protein